MDLHLPALDGLEATRRIRQYEDLRSVPIVGTSTFDTAEIQADAFAAGCTAFRRQPIDFDKFGDIADLILHRHTAQVTRKKGSEK
jgi:two-component system cell cycle response regulator DivK